MQSDTIIDMVSAHAEGEVGNVITGGVAPPPGDTLWQMRDWLHADQSLRNLVLNEPRGGVFTHMNLLVPPKDERAAVGFLTMEPEHTPPMSGSNAICVATVCLERGLVAMKEPETRFYLEAAAGLVAVRATCRNGKALSIEITNVASFADRLDVPLEIEGLGTHSVDIAYGGDSFVLIDAQTLGFALRPDEGRDIAVLGARISRAANEQIGFSHPKECWNQISFCQFTGRTRIEDGILTGTSAVVIDPGKIDRSPCGTGCSARMAVMEARGQLDVGARYCGRSIIGGRFDCRVAKRSRVAGKPAIVPTIAGRAWITGTHKILRDPTDPWPEGYRVTDTWPAIL
ncbi:MAG: proline racemase family protein [Halocynthiibacter sp.]